MISKVTLANLKAFGEEQSFEFASNPSPGVSKLTLLVGPNNSGKSSVVRALEDVLTAQSRVFTAAKEHRHGELRPKLSIRYENKDVTITESSGSKYNIVGGDDAIQAKIRYIPSRRPWNESFSNIMEDTAYSSNSRSNYRSNRYWVDQLFGAALMALSLNKERKGAFDALLKQVDPLIQDWRTETTGSQDFIEYRAETAGWHRIGDVGEGISSLFRICYELLHSKDNDTLLVDEPELSLHPQVQRNLARLILEKSFTRQFVVATHSPHFVSWKGLKSGAQIYRLNMTSTGSRVSSLSWATLDKITSIASSDKKNVMLYDAVAKEIFFSRGALFVEGAEDANILRLYMEENGLPEIEIFGYGAGGASNITTWLDMCRQLEIRAFGLYDGDAVGQNQHADAAARFKESPSIAVGILWLPDIRDKHDETGSLTKEGIFDSDWKVKLDHDGRLKALLSLISAHLSPQL